MTIDLRRPIAVYHEHPDWFRPLFAELDRRGLPYVRIDPRAHVYDPAARDPEYSLLFNRMSPSAHLREGVQGTFFTALPGPPRTPRRGASSTAARRSRWKRPRRCN